MFFSERICNCNITSALPPEKIKLSREYYTLAVLKYSFPEEFSKLRKSESPDLQDDNGLLGIEVTWGGSPQEELINGENYKFSHAKTESDRQKCLQKIRNNGGDKDDYSISFPVGTSEKDKKYIQNVITKKLKKIDSYREKSQRVGLAVLLDIPLFFFEDKQWGKWISEVNNGSFDFIILIHWSGIDIYDFKTQQYSLYRITKEERKCLQIIGRLTAEGIIGENDPEWQ